MIFIMDVCAISLIRIIKVMIFSLHINFIKH